MQPRIFQVLDRDDNHRLLREYDERDGKPKQRKLKALTHARRLNREEETAAA